jgi:SAM-dependent methyltransferase
VKEFGSRYAGVYDTLYRDKDYDAECALLEEIFARYGEGAIQHVLDLGCGTGNHVFPLARRGYEVVGVDRSAGMIARAKAKLDRSTRDRVQLRRADIRKVRLKDRFDAVLVMFAVLGYQLKDADVKATLQTVRTHLRPGGLFVFDVWHGPAVLAERPSQRVKVIRNKAERLIRVTSGELDEKHDVCMVSYELWHLKGKRVAAEVREVHKMRYFFPDSLRQQLAEAGLEPIRFSAFPTLDVEPSESSWNVIGVARAV